MLPQTVQCRFLRKSRRLYGNQKSPLSCRSSGSPQNIFETIGAIRTIVWEQGFIKIRDDNKKELTKEGRKGGCRARFTGKSKIHGSRELKQTFHESRTIQRLIFTDHGK